MRVFLISLLFLLLSTNVFAGKKIPKIKKSKGDGLLFSNMIDFYYIVDTKAQLCFVKTPQTGLSSISCKNLKKRVEWSEIITW